MCDVRFLILLLIFVGGIKETEWHLILCVIDCLRFFFFDEPIHKKKKMQNERNHIIFIIFLLFKIYDKSHVKYIRLMKVCANKQAQKTERKRTQSKYLT